MNERKWMVLLGAALLVSPAACSKQEPTKPEPAALQAFNDDFASPAIDQTKWNLSTGDGTAVLSGGKLTLSAPCGTFPYLTSKVNPFPSQGDFVLTVGIRYTTTPGAGTGFGPDWVNRGGFWVWQDANGFSAQVGDSSVTLTGNDLSYHVFEWRYVAGTYSLNVDGVSKGSSQSSFRPTSIFFGHVPYASCPWTAQEIDFVHIAPL